MLKTSLTLRPSGRLDAWRRQFDAKEDEMVVAAATPPLAAGEVTALSSLSASLWPRDT